MINQPSDIFASMWPFPPSSLLDSGFGHRTCFGQGDISKQDSCRGLIIINASILGFVHLTP